MAMTFSLSVYMILSVYYIIWNRIWNDAHDFVTVCDFLLIVKETVQSHMILVVSKTIGTHIQIQYIPSLKHDFYKSCSTITSSTLSPYIIIYIVEVSVLGRFYLNVKFPLWLDDASLDWFIHLLLSCSVYILVYDW